MVSPVDFVQRHRNLLAMKPKPHKAKTATRFCSIRRKWTIQYSPYSDEYLANDYHRTEPDGRRYRISDMRGPGGAATSAQHARAAARRLPPMRPTPEQLRREPELPPMPIKGGKLSRSQPVLPLEEPLMAAEPSRKFRHDR